MKQSVRFEKGARVFPRIGEFFDFERKKRRIAAKGNEKNRARRTEADSSASKDFNQTLIPGMEDTTRLTDPEDERRRENEKGDAKRRASPNGGQARSSKQEFGDDECSTDSGCSSGGSSGSAERLSRRGSSERLCRAARLSRTHCYLDRLRGRPTRSQERLSSVQRSSARVRAKSSRSWSPGDVRGVGRTSESLSYSSTPSDAHSSTDSDSLKRSSTADALRRALQTLKISAKWEGKENKHAKKSPKRILRSPVAYTYVKGLSGLPTQRVPRNVAQQLAMPCSCQNSVGIYR